MSNDPTQGGLSITPDKVEQDLDVFAYVLRKLRADADPLRPFTAIDYIKKARELFTANAPIATDFIGSTLGLRFQDGSVLPFCHTPDSGMNGVGGSISVSAPDKSASDGKGKTEQTGSWGVGGHEQS